MRIAVLKTLVFTAALIPVVRLIVGFFTDNLTANPFDYITDQTGWFALMCLVASLSVTPLRRVTKWHAAIRFRRMLGLFAFFYATLHLLTWVVLDQFFDYHAMIKDVFKRPFITVGMTTFVLLLPLALTSTTGMIRRLGGKRWNRLHRLAYVAGIAAVTHFWWLVKSDVREPQRWALVLTVLLGLRAWWAFQARSPVRTGTRP